MFFVNLWYGNHIGTLARQITYLILREQELDSAQRDRETRTDYVIRARTGYNPRRFRDAVILYIGLKMEETSGDISCMT